MGSSILIFGDRGGRRGERVLFRLDGVLGWVGKELREYEMGEEWRIGGG